MAVPKPDYLSRDYTSLKTSLLQYSMTAFPEWQPASEGDLGVVMLEAFAYVGDILSYYTDRAQFESYLPTATQRDSVLSLAYLLGYIPNSGTPATGTVRLVTGNGVPATHVPAGTSIATNRIEAIDGPVFFETTVDAELLANGATNDPIPVVEGESVTYTKIGESTGQPGQILSLPHSGVYRDTIRIYVEDNLGSTNFIEGTTAIHVREWLARDHLLDSGFSDTVFEAQYNDRATYILFGDDINGAIPGTGLSIYATYRHGVGSKGNVPAGAVRLMNDRQTGNVNVEKASDGTYLSSEMLGGTDPESTESIRYNAPRAYRVQNRIVTKKDFIDAALGVQGVLKANVVVGTFTSVTIYITGPDGAAPSNALKDTVAKQMKDRTLAGTEVTVADPTFVPVNLGTEASPVFVRILDQYSQRAVKAAAQRLVAEQFVNLAFGEPLSVGRFYERLASIEGVVSIDIPVLARNDATQEGVVTLNPREWEIFTLGTLHITLTGGTA